MKQTEDGWGELITNIYIKSLSQEHRIISSPKHLIANYKIGDYLIVLPVHSYVIVSAMKFYQNNSEIIHKL